MEENSIEPSSPSGYELTWEESILSLKMSTDYYVINGTFYSKQTGMSAFEDMGHKLRMINVPLASYYFEIKNDNQPC